MRLIMKYTRHLLMISMLAVISACGQKGDLYLPDSQLQQTD